MAILAPNDRDWAIVAVRWLLGVQCLLSGLNWWFKILPFPNIHEDLSGPIKHQILATMIESGWMFSSAKAIEILFGLALILNRHAVLMMVIGFPVMLMTFLLDLFPFLGHVAAGAPMPVLWHSFLDMLYFGAGVFVMQAYLMAEWFGDYRSLFVVRPGGAAAGWSGVLEAGWLKLVLRWLAYVVGGSSTVWAVLMALGLVPWSSLAVLAPPH